MLSELAEMSPSLQAGRVKRFSVFVGTVCVGMCTLSVSAWLRKPDSWVDCRVVLSLSEHRCPQFFGLIPSSPQSRRKKKHWGAEPYCLCVSIFLNVWHTQPLSEAFQRHALALCLTPCTFIFYWLAPPCAPLKAPRAFVIYDPCKVLVKSFCADCTSSLVHLWGMKMGH